MVSQWGLIQVAISLLKRIGDFRASLVLAIFAIYVHPVEGNFKPSSSQIPATAARASRGFAFHARTPTTATPSAPSTRASISAAFIPATAYIASGEAWSMNTSGSTIER